MTTVIGIPTLPAMPLLVLDPAAAERMLAERKRLGQDRKDEVWNGTYLMSPDPNYDHQELVLELAMIFKLTQKPRGAKVYPGGNVTDRREGWTENYRCPDVIVLFPENPAIRTKAALIGGPDFVVEILSPYDRAREKLPFYGQIKTRECLYIDREQECVELYRLQSEQMELVARLTAENGAECQSEVLQLGFCLVLEGSQTVLVVRQASEPSQTWHVDLLI